jgi:hypothetical protein
MRVRVLISSRWANSLAPIGPIQSHDLPQRVQSRLRDGELRCEFSTRGGETALTVETGESLSIADRVAVAQ